jgi:hypothetical protein
MEIDFDTLGWMDCMRLKVAAEAELERKEADEKRRAEEAVRIAINLRRDADDFLQWRRPDSDPPQRRTSNDWRRRR